jgi:hypothetical protein
MTKRLTIVGNGPIGRDLSAHVDAADFVLRFNEPKASKGMSGVRTDLLFLNNSGKPMQRRLLDPAYIASPIVRAAKEVVFTYHPEIIRRYLVKPNILSRLKGRRADWTMQAIDLLGGAGKEIRILPPAFYEAGCAELGLTEAHMRTVFPSTGYFGIRYALERFQPEDWAIEMCGFSWEGWKRHAWADERGWVERHVAAGRIALVD